MKLFTLDDETKLPVASPEALMIKCFNDLWRTKKPIPGDFDGRKKTLNSMELAYVYFQGTFDSRFKLKQGKEKEEAIRKIIGLPTDWTPDTVVIECIEVYRELQKSASSELVLSLEGAVEATAKYINSAKTAIANGNINSVSPDDVKRILDIIDRAPTTIETVTRAKAVLQKEQDALVTGRKGRIVNKYELPD